MQAVMTTNTNRETIERNNAAVMAASAAASVSTATHHRMPAERRRSRADEERLRRQREQFEALILPHEPSLYGPAMALTRSASDAEDLVQDTLLRAFDRFDTFRADGSPRAWLHTIMRNLFFNAYRKRSREPKQVSLEFFDPATSVVSGGAGSAMASAVAPQQPTVSSPERQVLSQMEGAAVLKAVKALPEEYRIVVALADIQGLPYQEIADQLHIPVGTVRSRLSRGRERVRRAVFAWRPSGETAATVGALGAAAAAALPA